MLIKSQGPGNHFPKSPADVISRSAEFFSETSSAEMGRSNCRKMSLNQPLMETLRLSGARPDNLCCLFWADGSLWYVGRYNSTCRVPTQRFLATDVLTYWTAHDAYPQLHPPSQSQSHPLPLQISGRENWQSEENALLMRAELAHFLEWWHHHGILQYESPQEMLIYSKYALSQRVRLPHCHLITPCRWKTDNSITKS